jgi:hypothetical protein
MRRQSTVSVFEWIDRQEHRYKNPNQYQPMPHFSADRLIEPIDEFVHAAARFKWRSRFRSNSQTFAVGSQA